MVTTFKDCRGRGACQVSRSVTGTRGRRGGFTLAELLVVISIIIILVSMLMPSLDGVRERGYVTLCQNNLEKISQALATSSSNAGGRRPTGASWLAAASAYGSKEILVCPKGFYRGGGGGVEITGDVEVIPAPPSAKFNDLEDNKIVRMWQEREYYSLQAPVAVNISNPGRYGGNNGSYTGISGTIAAGTAVECHFLHFDPVGSQGASTSGQVIKFSDEIIGIICRDAELDATDLALGSQGTVYAGGQGSRGFEVGHETVEVSADRRSFQILSMYSTFPGEDVRILTRPTSSQVSYGINSKVAAAMTNPDQIYIVEYERTKVNIDDPKWSAYTALRHFGKSNALMVDGAVRLLSPEEFDRDKGHWRP